MRVRTLIRYLLGREEAILGVASDPGALGTGLLLVCSAAFAREYDGVSLLHEPWHLALPIVASLGSSLLLFALVRAAAWRRVTAMPAFLPAYRSLLSCYWMTAPLAWLYAIPFERFLTTVGAMQANLCCLGIVAAWRVCLMIRVVSVLWRGSGAAAGVLVLAFADAVALLALAAIPMPLIELMGGIRRSPADELLHGVRSGLFGLGCFTLPGWLLAAAFVVGHRGLPWRWTAAPPGDRAPGWLGGLAWASVLCWTAVLPITQPEQIRAARVSSALRGNRIPEALDAMSAAGPDGFPPGWEPPPRLGWIEAGPDAPEVLESMVGRPVAPWVRALYVNRLASDDWGLRGLPPERARRLFAEFPELLRAAPARLRNDPERQGVVPPPREDPPPRDAADHSRG